MRARLVALLLVAVALAATAVYALTSLNRDSTDRAIALVPEDAFVYGHVFVKPSVDQRKALRSLLDHFPQAPEADEALDPFFARIDEGLEQYDMTYEDDVRPWLGDQVAFYLTGPASGGGLIAVEDIDAAQAFIDVIDDAQDTASTEGSYRGVDYELLEGGGYAFIDDFLALAPEEDLRAIIDVHNGAGSLDAVDQYADMETEVTADRVFSVYLDAGGVAELIGAGDGGFAAPADGLSEIGSVMVAGHLRDDAVVFELAGEKGGLPIPSGAFDLAAGIPSDGWLALGSPGLGGTLEKGIESFAGAAGASLEALLGRFTAETGFDLRDDFLAWMEDSRLYVRGTGVLDLGGAVSIGSSDPAASAATIERFVALAGQQGIPVEPVEVGGIDGYALEIPGGPRPVIVVPGDRVVVAYGRDAAEDALDPDEPLTDSERFETAADHLGAGLDAYLYLDVDSVQRLVENFMPPSDVYVSEVQPWLDPVALVIAGSKFGDDSYLVRFVIGVE